MRGKRTAASGQNGKGAVGEILKMRALTLKSKAGSKCWLMFPPPCMQTHSFSFSLSE